MTKFSQVPKADIYRFVCGYPLAWIAPVADPGSALLMPLLFDDIDCTSIVGHLPRRIADSQAFQRSSSVVCLFLGPHSYIPPEWAGKDDWVPTWNFMSLKIEGDMQMSTEMTRSAVEFLVDHMQAKSKSDWTLDKVGHRIDSLLDRIIGFRIDVNRLTPRFKLGQDEDDETYANLKDRLALSPLSAWMRR